MKKLSLRTSLALACALGLSACGGGGADLQLVISPIVGVTKPGLTIKNNGGAAIAIDPGVLSFLVPGGIGTDTNYDITIATPPSNATCVIVNGKGKTGSFAPQGIRITCVANPHNVTANITGLTGGDLVVVNGPMSYTIPANATTFNFTQTAADGTKTGEVGDGNSYAFVVLTQPAGKTCTIPNGVGVMGNTDIAINISCV